MQRVPSLLGPLAIGVALSSVLANTVSAQSSWVRTGLLGPWGGVARDVNDVGQVVGDVFIGERNTRAYLWTRAGGLIDLGTLGGATSKAYAINDAEQVVGDSANATGVQRAFLWTAAGGLIDLGSLGGIPSGTRAINAR